GWHGTGRGCCPARFCYLAGLHKRTSASRECYCFSVRCRRILSDARAGCPSVQSGNDSRATPSGGHATGKHCGAGVCNASKSGGVHRHTANQPASVEDAIRRPAAERGRERRCQSRLTLTSLRPPGLRSVGCDLWIAEDNPPSRLQPHGLGWPRLRPPTSWNWALQPLTCGLEGPSQCKSSKALMALPSLTLSSGDVGTGRP